MINKNPYEIQIKKKDFFSHEIHNSYADIHKYDAIYFH